MKRSVVLAMAAAVSFIPSLAWACPVCAGRETNTSMVVVLLGLMIAVPYAISVVAIRVIRKADQETKWLQSGIKREPEAQQP